MMSLIADKKNTFRIQFYPPRKLYCVSHVGPYAGNPDLFEELFNKVLDWMQTNQIRRRRGMEAITIYHDDPEKVPMEKQRISVGFTCDLDAQPKGDIEVIELPAGNYAVGNFEIFMNQYGEAWKDLFTYVKGENLKPDMELMYESYKNNPSKHPEGKHIVDIGVRLK